MRLALVLLAFGGSPVAFAANEEIPFVPTPIEVVDRMLDLAEVKPGDLLFDLGSGDGRVVIRAAKRFGARAVGIEMDSDLVARSIKKAQEEGVSHLVEFRQQDALQVDVSLATVVTLYMLPWFNEAMRPVLQKQLKPGARVVAHDFGIEGWPPTRIETLPAAQDPTTRRPHHHTIFLWKVGE